MQAEIGSQAGFSDLVERLRRDDRAAVGLVVGRYGDALRRSIEHAVRVGRLAGMGTHPGRDPEDREASDIGQAVLLLFLARLRRPGDSPGEAQHFESPAQLLAYLEAIGEHERARRRAATVGGSAEGPDSSPGVEPAADGPTTGQEALMREILERDRAALDEIVRRLGPGERDTWELVRQGLGWPEIARRLGEAGSPEAVRQAFARAVRRIADDLKTGELIHE